MKPLRAILRMAALAGWIVSVYPLLLLVVLLNRPWPRAAIALRRFTTRWWARGWLWILGVQLQVNGEPPEPPFFAAGNHLSYLDILVLHASLRGRFLSKAEVGQWPVAGHFARLAGTLFLQRERKRDLGRANNELSATIRGGEGVIVFPEGTSTRGETVLPFRASLFQVAVDQELPIAPFALHYSVAPSAPPAHISVCWWGEMEMAPHFWALLMLNRITARVTFIPPSPQASDRKALAQTTWDKVQQHFEPSYVV